MIFCKKKREQPFLFALFYVNFFVFPYFFLKEPLNNSLHAQSFRLVRNLGALLKVYVHPSKKCNNECGPA